jgi:tetratricopeptide (TPR) repeat protein
MEDIEKLRLRVEKDPNSRLFLPLAEEYRKMGMVDEAISVILRGLEHQPGYTSARVALGRLYVEKSMVNEAKSEFEAVVKAIPDNLFAHRKLADIYKEQGETEKAIDEYKTVIHLNPLDEDAMLCLQEIQGRALGEETAAPVMPEMPSPDLPAGEEPGEAVAVDEAEPEEAPDAEAPAEPGAILEDDFEQFKGAFPGMKEEPLDVEEALELPDDQPFEIPDESSFGDVLDEVPEAEEEVSVFPEPDVHEEPEPAVARQGTPGAADADAFIAGGNFYKALEVYRSILANDPENKQILQRAAELKALMTMMGKGNEVLIAKLESFLDSVNRRMPKRL